MRCKAKQRLEKKRLRISLWIILSAVIVVLFRDQEPAIRFHSLVRHLSASAVARFMWHHRLPVGIGKQIVVVATREVFLLHRLLFVQKCQLRP